MPAWIATVLFVVDMTVKVVALGVVPRNRRPSSGMAWLLVIFLIPFLGIAVFLMMGRTRLGGRRNEQQAEVNAIIAERMIDVATLEADFSGPEYIASIALLNRNLSSLPMSAGNRVDLLPEYGEAIAAMTAEVDRADDWVHVEFYITAWAR